MAIVSIATKASRKVISDAQKAQKNGETVDWEKVLQEAKELEAKNKDEQIKAIMEKKK